MQIVYKNKGLSSESPLYNYSKSMIGFIDDLTLLE